MPVSQTFDLQKVPLFLIGTPFASAMLDQNSRCVHCQKLIFQSFSVSLNFRP